MGPAQKKVAEYIRSVGRARTVEIARALGVERSACSQILSKLRDAGIVAEVERNGSSIYYALTSQAAQVAEEMEPPEVPESPSLSRAAAALELSRIERRIEPLRSRLEPLERRRDELLAVLR